VISSIKTPLAWATLIRYNQSYQHALVLIAEGLPRRQRARFLMKGYDNEKINLHYVDDSLGLNSGSGWLRQEGRTHEACRTQ